MLVKDLNYYHKENYKLISKYKLYKMAKKSHQITYQPEQKLEQKLEQEPIFVPKVYPHPWKLCYDLYKLKPWEIPFKSQLNCREMTRSCGIRGLPRNDQYFDTKEELDQYLEKLQSDETILLGRISITNLHQ